MYFAQLSLGDKVVIAEEEYAALKEDLSYFNKIIELRDFIKKNYYLTVDDEAMKDGMMKGLFNALDDPYSVYMTQQEFKDFSEISSGVYGGVGIIVSPGEDNLITIVSPIEDTPGERAGIKSGDKIILVDGEEVFADKLDYAISRIKGTPGESVILSIRREGKDDFPVTLVRELIQNKAIKSEMKDNKIGYIRITIFDDNVAAEFEEHLEALIKQGMSSLIIDLRNNPGGSLQECVTIADRLLGKQTIVYTMDNTGKKEYEYSDERKLDMPMVVLVNSGSASASEILTGAIQDSKSGTIIGTTTFGKGLVQWVRPLIDESGFKLTISQYFTPNGTYIHGKGIVPDVVIELADSTAEGETLTPEEDPQLQKAIEVLTH
jgi:carboxyl-terminal processing protease